MTQLELAFLCGHFEYNVHAGADPHQPVGLIERVLENLISNAIPGLELVIAWRIVELHGGRIQMRSMPGSGTRFEVELPLSGCRISMDGRGH